MRSLDPIVSFEDDRKIVSKIYYDSLKNRTNYTITHRLFGTQNKYDQNGEPLISQFDYENGAIR
jgi:hypothetical protein